MNALCHTYESYVHNVTHKKDSQHTLRKLRAEKSVALQHTATYCNTLQRAATRCNTLQHTATHCNTLQHTATHCYILQHTATCCKTLQHTATPTPCAIKWREREYTAVSNGRVSTAARPAQRSRIRMDEDTHIWMSGTTHMNESYHTYEWVKLSDVTHMNEPCWVMQHVLDDRVMSHIDDGVMSHIEWYTRWMRDVTHMNESCWVMSHIEF